MSTKISILIILFAQPCAAQEITGKVWATGYSPLAHSVVKVYKEEILKFKIITDTDGSYSVKLPGTGNYNMLFECKNYYPMSIKDVPAKTGHKTIQNVVLAKNYDAREK